jgi:phage protein D
MGLGIAIEVGGESDAELANATWVEVTERMGETTTYRIRYDFDVADGDFPQLTDSRTDPGSELTILEPVGSVNQCLVKGPVTAQRIHVAHGGAGSWVEVHGADNSIRMDRESKAAVWSDVSDSDAVNSIFSSYGFTPDVAPTDAQHAETKHTLVQRDTDLEFVHRQARRNGFLFWLTCDANGSETAHFRRPQLDGNDGPALTVNQENNNLQWFDLDWNVETPTSAVAADLDLSDASDLDGAVSQSPLDALGAQPLAEIVTDTRSLHLTAPADTAGDLQNRSQGALIESGWFIRGRCQTTLSALQNLVRASTVVNVSGLGSRHSGKYFVASVRHTIDQSEHRMDIELVRNAWGNS